MLNVYLSLASLLLVIIGNLCFTKSWRYRNLSIVKILILLSIISFFSCLFLLVSIFSASEKMALLLIISAEFLFAVFGAIAVGVIEFLRVPKASDVVLTLTGFIIFFRILSLISDTYEMVNINNLWLVKLISVSTYLVLATSLYILLIIIEFLLFLGKGLRFREKRRGIMFLMLPFSVGIAISVFFLYFLSSGNFDITLNYGKYIFVGIFIAVTSLILYYDPESILLLPVEMFGVTITTKEGVEITSRTLKGERAKHVRLGTLLLGLIYSLNLEFERHELTDTFESITLEDFNLLIYYGRNLIGAVIGKGQNLIVEDWLKNVVIEIERRIGDIETGLITDHEMQIADNILGRYERIFGK